MCKQTYPGYDVHGCYTSDLNALAKTAATAKAELDAILKRSDATTEAVEGFIADCGASDKDSKLAQ